MSYKIFLIGCVDKIREITRYPVIGEPLLFLRTIECPCDIYFVY